ncbi:unnamed protein product [Microthlaspi erraticum]|uniref:RNase H type-1 domain-containing protein n=1 Tax=Microthlaspi erraticum TaxID=1685480 RepID=A0A6D2K0J4_9BRAS|nr:unnamed protein product [Microthlaspi erraticum]
MDLEDNIRRMMSIMDQSQLPNEVRLLPIWIVWMIWKSRNEFLFQQKTSHPHMEANKGINALAKWLQANPVEQQQRHDRRHPLSQWEPPPQHFLKCNFDSSYCRDLDYMRVGWLVRDSHGACLDAGWAKLHKVDSALEAKATGFLYVVQRIWSRGWRHIWFEGDNKDLTSIINKQQHHVELGNLIFDIRHWIQKLPLCSLDHVNREKN